jgi:uncharacterized membrane protein YccC
MAKLFNLDKSVLLSNFHYIVKCVAGVIVCYLLYKWLPQYPFYWAIISVVIVLSPDNSTSQAVDRIKANVLGCTVGMCLYPLHLPNLLLLCAGVVITAVIGLAIKLGAALRSALAALIIITIDIEQGDDWYIAIGRMFCVVAGCLVALLVTILFNVIFDKLGKNLKLGGK